MPKKQQKGTERTAILSALQPKQHIPEDVYVKIAAVHNSSVGHWGQATLNDPSITDRMISMFIRQCPCCQVMSRLKVQIKTHPYTCASYNPFKVIHLDCIGPHGNMFILMSLGNWLSENYRSLSEFWRQIAAQLFSDRFRGCFGANSSFAAVSEVFWELIAPNLMILLLFR
jgi:hypothetical protein